MSLDARQLADALDFATISYTESTESTNTDLLADADAGPWTVRITTNQTAGKGRLGRVWEAPPGANRIGTIPLAAGLAVADAISGTRLKWPNDVLLGEKKLCGILAEASAAPRARVVVGWGINVALREDQLPVPHATSLQIAGKSTDHTQVAADVLRNFYERMQQWQDNDPQLLDDYRSACASIGVRVRLERHSDTIEGTVDTVTDDGRISIDGKAFSAGDVSHLRRQDGNYS